VLRMSVPVILGQEPFLDFLSGFLKAQPRIRIDLFITNLFSIWLRKILTSRSASESWRTRAWSPLA